MKIFKIKYFTLIIFTVGQFLLIPKASAYAGPGAAIAIIFVFLSVVIAFIASIFIKILNLFKKNKKTNISKKKKKLKKKI